MISTFTLEIFVIVMTNFPGMGITVKVFTFNKDNSAINEMSSASMSNVPRDNLPDHFMICSSHTQQQIDTPHTRAIYVLFKDPNFTKPWFSIGFYRLNKLWANTNFAAFHSLGNVTRETFLSWIHICVEVDTIAGIMRASVNGGNVTTVHNVHDLAPTPKLYLRLGVVNESFYGDPAQFLGTVTNVKIFHLEDQNNENLLISATKNPCNLIKRSSYVDWSISTWTLVGKGVKETILKDKLLCSESKVHNLRIPLKWNKFEAVKECKKYGGAVISKPPSHDMVNVTKMELDLTYGDHFQECEYFWTPFSDELAEGTYIDEKTNETLRYCDKALA